MVEKSGLVVTSAGTREVGWGGGSFKKESGILG